MASSLWEKLYFKTDLFEEEKFRTYATEMVLLSHLKRREKDKQEAVL